MINEVININTKTEKHLSTKEISLGLINLLLV